MFGRVATMNSKSALGQFAGAICVEPTREHSILNLVMSNEALSQRKSDYKIPCK